MNVKDKIKLAFATVLGVCIFFGTVTVGAILTPTSLWGPLYGALLGFLLMMLYQVFLYPIWFSEYIKEFRGKQ